MYVFLCVCVSVFVCVHVCVAPDSLYEVRVWAYNKQAEGAAATWTGRTEKDRDKREDFLNGHCVPHSEVHTKPCFLHLKLH